MKKIFLLLSSALAVFEGNAQHTIPTNQSPLHTIAPDFFAASAYKTTKVGDTAKLTHINSTDTLTIYKYGTNGYVTGTNSFGDMGFAERYDINGFDSSVVVIGVMAQFTGKVNPASTKSVNFKLWNESVPVVVSGSLIYSGFPSTSFDTLTVPFTQLGIGTIKDTLKSFMFATPSRKLVSAFFVGYDMSYDYTTLSGDTIGLATSMDGHRTQPLNYIDTFISEFEDTVITNTINVVNATQWSDNIWHENYTQNDSIFNNLAIFPIVVINTPTGISKITRNSLSLFGNYPNPASNSTNIKFALLKNADVTIQVTNMNGQIISETKSTGLKKGENTMTINTSELPAGTYIYLLHTSTGDGIASQFTVSR